MNNPADDIGGQGDSGESHITSVERQPNNPHRYNIFLDGHYAFSVHQDVLIKHRLLKGERINGGRLERIAEDEERHDAYMDAVAFLGRRPRSGTEVTRRLKLKGYDPHIIDSVMERLRKQNYVNDAKFAEIWADYRINSQKKGRKWVRQELRHKGVPEQYIADAMEQVDEEDEYRSAYELALKKWKQHDERDADETHAQRRKIAAFLLRRGFPNSIINRVLKQLNNSQRME